jgi:hypothetical protein
MRPQFVCLAFGLMLASGSATAEQLGNRIEPCMGGHRFEPGPIVNGRHRQPTQIEIQARMQELQAWGKRNQASCSTAPGNSDAGILSPATLDHSAELASPSLQK